jgi:hypothetical protein
MQIYPLISSYSVPAWNSDSQFPWECCFQIFVMDVLPLNYDITSHKKRYIETDTKTHIYICTNSLSRARTNRSMAVSVDTWHKTGGIVPSWDSTYTWILRAGATRNASLQAGKSSAMTVPVSWYHMLWPASVTLPLSICHIHIFTRMFLAPILWMVIVNRMAGFCPSACTHFFIILFYICDNRRFEIRNIHIYMYTSLSVH